MDDFFASLAQHRGGYIRRPDLLDLGFDDRQIRDAIRSKVLVRLRPGTYAPRGHEGLSPEERHRILAFAAQDKLPADVVISHHSAAVIHTGVSFGLDLETVHVTRPDRTTARTEAKVVHHGGRLPEEDVVEVDGHRLVIPSRAVLETASIAGTEAGMVQVSHLLRQGADEAELLDRLDAMSRWPGVAKVRLALMWAAPECESVGEVRSVYMFRMGGLPIPRMQVDFFDGHGGLLGRVDFDWEDFWHCGEFDGLVKYGRLNPYSGADLGQVLVEEKRREDRIREIPRGMSRWIYADLNSPKATCQRIRAAMEQSRRLYGRPRRTTIP